MLRHEFATILSLTVMLATFFKHKSYFKYIENMPAKFQSYMSSHSLAIARQKYNEVFSYMEISLNFHTLFKALPLAKK